MHRKVRCFESGMSVNTLRITAQVAGVKKDDWIVAVEGRTDFTRETDVIRHLLTVREKDSPISIEVWRNGKRSKLQVARK